MMRVRGWSRPRGRRRPGRVTSSGGGRQAGRVFQGAQGLSQGRFQGLFDPVGLLAHVAAQLRVQSSQAAQDLGKVALAAQVFHPQAFQVLGVWLPGFPGAPCFELLDSAIVIMVGPLILHESILTGGGKPKVPAFLKGRFGDYGGHNNRPSRRTNCAEPKTADRLTAPGGRGRPPGRSPGGRRGPGRPGPCGPG